ncbi:hypothetical protein [Winogradskyella sp. PG-2]|uniref:hypothetical protein n=1 Tax=Winogradskyella sp. PG-2 TaxID=754409 RepID=UPI0004587F8A|nr:hypothetical protein [Winogradskyella sp. PG-2]BAO74992.1 hypothetical protein WPG_0762 [Winogradskyella sp. PG-2]
MKSIFSTTEWPKRANTRFALAGFIESRMPAIKRIIETITGEKLSIQNQNNFQDYMLTLS